MIRKYMMMTAVALALPATPVLAQDLDMDVVFNCSDPAVMGAQSADECLAARTHLLNNCTSCHTFVPIVKAQKTPEAWTAHMNTHRERVMHMTDSDYQALTDFLKSHYTPEHEPPTLPPALEALSTNSPA